MPANRPPKRRKGPTPRKRPASPDTHPAGVDRPELSIRPDATPRVEPSSRYTPKQKARGPFRPTWHKAIGALMLLAGAAIFIINDLAWFDINWIPGGHSELYAMLAFAVAGTSTWWFGWFDRPPGKTW
jgi:hypothetical protein